MQTTNRRHRVVRWCGVILVMAGLLAACGGDDDDGATDASGDTEASEAAEQETTTTEVDAEAEAAEVSTVLTEFFSLVGQGDFTAASAMIENGEAAEPRLLHCADLVSGIAIENVEVELTDSETATATFSILKDGVVLLEGSGGGAVKVDDQWLVSENTFLSLYDAAKDSCTGPPPPE
ncbi:MAG: hypothetical protein ACRD2C_08340 [Acidimicrobiales bacterium]